MSSLYKRATPRQHMVLRMIEGAVRNAAHAHPGRSIDDERIARSIAKRAAGTLIAGWQSVLATPRVRSEGAHGELTTHDATRTGQRGHTGSGKMGVAPEDHNHREASNFSWRLPVRALHRAIGAEVGKAKRAGCIEREAVLIDVLRLMARYLESERMPDPRKRWSFQP